jgi:hypothetical protein
MSFTVQFMFVPDEGQLNVLLEADVETDAQNIHFCVRNFRVPGHVRRGILPEIFIKRSQGRWVHRDSGWQTPLSEAVGEAIEKAGVLVSESACEGELRSRENSEGGGLVDAAIG